MRSLNTRITIRARSTSIFQVLTDFAHYGDWNPWTHVKDGEAVEGARIKLRPYQGLYYCPTLTYEFYKVQKPDLLQRRTVGLFSYLLRIYREHVIYTKTDGASLISSRVSFSGPLAGIVYLVYRQPVLRRLREEAAALKKHCETHTPLSRDNK